VTQPANAEAIATWSRMPEETLGAFDPEGHAGRRVLLDPHIFRLLGDVTGRMVLDAGCGQGYLARLLAGRGARVTGVEPAEAPYRYAIARERDRRQGIYYLQADLSEAGGLDGQFDAVVANVVFESIPDWAPALETCVRALRLGGLLVFSLEHPCFEDAAVSRLCAGTRVPAGVRTAGSARHRLPPAAVVLPERGHPARLHADRSHRAGRASWPGIPDRASRRPCT